MDIAEHINKLGLVVPDCDNIHELLIYVTDVDALKYLVVAGADTKYDDERLFRHICANNQFKLLAWLHKFRTGSRETDYANKNPNTINCEANNHEAMRNACEHGDLDMVRVLLKYFPNIDVSFDDDYAFRTCVDRDFIHIAKLLLNRENTTVNVFANNCEAIECAKRHCDEDKGKRAKFLLNNNTQHLKHPEFVKLRQFLADKGLITQPKTATTRRLF